VLNLAVLARVLRAATKKGHQLFEEKSAPPTEKIRDTPYGSSFVARIFGAGEGSAYTGVV